MGLFGPNIQKMKKSRDIKGLLAELSNKDPEIRISATDALAELKHIQALLSAIGNDDPEVRLKVVRAIAEVDDPDVTEALITIVITDRGKLVWQEAFDALNKFHRLDQTLWVHMGFELTKTKLNQRALKCFDKAIENNPDKEFIGSIGASLVDHQEYQSALKYFDQFINIDPEDPRGWGGKGMALAGLNMDQEAIRCCEKALVIDPGLAGARNTISAVYYKREDYDALRVFASETLQTQPGNIKAHVSLAEALMMTGELSEAQAELNKVLGNQDVQESLEAEDLSMLHEELGILHVMMGRKDLAYTSFQEAFNILGNEWDRQLHETLKILDVLGLAQKGTPQDRRGRLLGLAQQRAQATGYTYIHEKLIGDTDVEDVSNFPDDYGESRLSVEIMLKFWTAEHFAEFKRSFSRRGNEALIATVEQILVGPNRREEVNEMAEKREDMLAHILNLCESDPDAGLEFIERTIIKDPEAASDPFGKFAEAMAYGSKGLFQLSRSKPEMDFTDFDENELRNILGITDVHLDNLEKGLKAIRVMEDIHPGALEMFGIEEDKAGELKVDAMAMALERCRPGRVQQILGKTKLKYYGVDRLKILPSDIMSQQPLERYQYEFTPFCNVFFSYNSIVKSAMVVHLAEDRTNMWIWLFNKTFDDFGEDETLDDARVGVGIYDILINIDGTFKAWSKEENRLEEEAVLPPRNVAGNIRCPICDSETTVRTAKQGPNVGSQFNVCTRYPECKGKIAVE